MAFFSRNLRLGPVFLRGGAVFGALALAACGAAMPGGYGLLAYGCPENAVDLLADVDWKRAETFTISVRHDEYDPMIVPLRKGRAYVIRFENRDDYNHRFNAPEFFQSVALKGVSVADGSEDPEACIRGLGLPAEKTVTVRLIPTRDGHFGFEESGIGTRLFGDSFGAITVK